MHISGGLVSVSLSIIFLGACDSKRPAEPEERTYLLEQIEMITALIPSEPRFRRSKLDRLPELNSQLEITTADEGKSFALVSDSLVGTIDSVNAEFLLNLPTSVSDSSRSIDLMVRARREGEKWTTTGLYIR